MADSRFPNDSGDHGFLGTLRSIGRRIASLASTAATFVAHTAMPKLRVWFRSVGHAAGRALRSWGSAVGAAFVTACHAIGRFFTRLVVDMRPSTTSRQPDGRTDAANGQLRAATMGAASSSGAQRDMHHVYMVRRIIVFGSMALVAIALVVGIVLGVRALTSSPDVPARIATSGQRSDKAADGQSDVQADQSDKAEGQSSQSDDSDESGAPDAIVPLTDQERVDILAAAQQTVADSGNTPVEYTYCIASQGDVGDLTEFSNIVYSTLNDPRGWPRAGATFQENTNGDPNACDMTLTLASADQMTTFSTECSDEYSCRVGNDVVINIDRWNNATEDWLNAGGTVERYRTMVINHEVGHRLGHFDNETTCPAVNQPAPLMQQQSMDLLGCMPNEWPLDDELWVSQ